jgi:hypothetical protein
VNKYSTIFSDIKAQFIHLQVNLSGYDLESATGGSMVITVQIKLTYGPKVLGKNSVADNSYKNSSIFLPNFQTISLNYSYYKTTFK